MDTSFLTLNTRSGGHFFPSSPFSSTFYTFFTKKREYNYETKSLSLVRLKTLSHYHWREPTQHCQTNTVNPTLCMMGEVCNDCIQCIKVSIEHSHRCVCLLNVNSQYNVCTFWCKICLGKKSKYYSKSIKMK